MRGHRASPICFYLAAAWLAGPGTLPLRPQGAAQAIQGLVTDASERGHLLGDVPALLVVAIVLAVLTPRAAHR